MTQVPDALIRKLTEIEQAFLTLDQAIQDPELFNDPDQARIKLKEHGRLKPMVESFRTFNKIRNDIASNKALIEEEDEELRELAEAELPELEEAEAKAAETLKDLFVSQDKDSESDVIIEINAGVGGDEASLFAGDLFRMYTRYAERRRWKLEVIDSHEGNVGGLKTASFTIEGQGVYRQLRFESGGHRVQRVPSTETQGRIHTSMCTVVVLPQVEEVDVEIDKADVKIDKYSASGPGGQHVNKTQSAVRLTHGATGIVVQCQDEKSQHKNLARAWKVLRARVSDHYQAIAEKERGDQRRSLRGRGNRNERIRTYNFPQDRCTDHRVGVTVHGLAAIMDGDLDGLIEKLIATDKEETLKNL